MSHAWACPPRYQRLCCTEGEGWRESFDLQSNGTAPSPAASSERPSVGVTPAADGQR